MPRLVFLCQIHYRKSRIGWPLPNRSGADGDIDALKVERDENDQRKTPTVSERLAIAQRISERMQGRVGNPDLKPNCGNISTIEETGKTRDIAAKKAGLGSGKTLEAAQKVIEHGTPELIEAMDAGKLRRLEILHYGNFWRLAVAATQIDQNIFDASPLLAGHILKFMDRLEPLCCNGFNGS